MRGTGVLVTVAIAGLMMVAVSGSVSGGMLAAAPDDVLGVVPAAAPTAPARPAAPAAQDAAKQKPDEAPIRAVVKKYVDAREQRDEKALTALFTESVDQLVSSGEWRKGRDAVVKGTLASSQASGGVRTIEVETVQFPALGVAIADGRYEIAGLQGGATRKMWSTFVMTRHADGWKIAAIRNMLPAVPVPAAATPAPR